MKKPSDLLIAAKVLMIIFTVLSGFLILPLAWTIPMTVVYCSKLERGETIGVGFKICCLLFVNRIAGILMLCDTSELSMDKAPQEPYQLDESTFIK